MDLASEKGLLEERTCAARRSRVPCLPLGLILLYHLYIVELPENQSLGFRDEV